MGGALAAGPPLLFARLHPFLPKLSAPAVIPSERARVCSGLGYGNVRDSCAGRRRVRRGTAPPAALKALQPVDLTTTRKPSLYHDERVRMQQREPPRLRVRPSPPLPLVRRQAQPAHPTERAGQRERTASGTASAARSRVGPNVSGRSRTGVVPLPACNTDGVGMSCNRDKAAARQRLLCTSRPTALHVPHVLAACPRALAAGAAAEISRAGRRAVGGLVPPCPSPPTPARRDARHACGRPPRAGGESAAGVRRRAAGVMHSCAGTVPIPAPHSKAIGMC